MVSIAELIEKGIKELQKDMETLKKKVETEVISINSLRKQFLDGLDEFEQELATLQHKLKAESKGSKIKIDAQENLNAIASEMSELQSKINEKRSEVTTKLGQRVDEIQGDAKVYLKTVAHYSQNILGELEKELHELISEVRKRLK